MQNKGRKLPFYLVIAVFVMPMVIGWYLFHYHEYFHFKTKNFGELVNPPVSAQMIYASMPNGAVRKWRVVYVDAGVCDAACSAMKYQLHQVQKALGANSDRVLVVTLTGKSGVLKKLAEEFVAQGKIDFVVTNKIFLVDPDGYLFMYYPGTTDPMNVLKDLKNVLEVSEVG